MQKLPFRITRKNEGRKISKLQGDFYTGTDLGKERDFSVICVVKKERSILKIVFIKRFPLNTNYGSIIGYLKVLNERLVTIHSNYIDITGVGNAVVEEMIRAGIPSIQGITFTLQSKEEMATILREKMRNGEIKIPYVPAKKLEDIDLTAELNVEKFELMKTGHLRFSHPEGGHDDVFWSCCLACYAAVQAPLPGKGAVMLPH